MNTFWKFFMWFQLIVKPNSPVSSLKFFLSLRNGKEIRYLNLLGGSEVRKSPLLEEMTFTRNGMDCIFRYTNKVCSINENLPCETFWWMIDAIRHVCWKPPWECAGSISLILFPWKHQQRVTAYIWQHSTVSHDSTEQLGGGQRNCTSLCCQFYWQKNESLKKGIWNYRPNLVPVS